MTKNYDLILLVPYLGIGGSERIIVNLANYSVSKQKKVLLLILKKGGEFEAKLSEDVEIQYLNKNKTILSFFDILAILKKNNSKCIFSSLWHMNVILGLTRYIYPNKNINYIARETNIISESGLNNLSKKLLTLSYRKFDKIICQSDDMSFDLVNNFNINYSQLVKINNGVDIGNVEKEYMNNNTPVNDTRKVLLSIGKLEYQKGYDLLINIFKSAELENEYVLYILGGGSKYCELKNSIEQKGLSNSIILVGKVNNPYKYFNNAYAFISSSRFEGFPNVVLEALVCGVPVISNNYRGGINEIIKDYNGKIVDIENVIDFKQSLKFVDSLNREEIKVKSKDKYSIDKMCDEYFKVILN